MVRTFRCANCWGHIFIVEDYCEDVDGPLYSHDEDTGCDDPEPDGGTVRKSQDSPAK